MRIAYENNSYEVLIDEKTKKISQIKIRRNNPTIMNIVKILAVLTVSLFILDFFMDIGEKLVSGVSSVMSSSTPTSTSSVQTGGAGISFIRSVGKYLLAILTIGLYFFSFEWSILGNEEQDKLVNTKCFNDRVFAEPSTTTTTATTTPNTTPSTNVSKDTTTVNSKTESTPTQSTTTIESKPTGQTATTDSTVPSATSSKSVPAPAPVNSDSNSKVEKFTNYYGSSLSYSPFE
jgi:hypothetical protein